jgi:hypothetical protein
VIARVLQAQPLKPAPEAEDSVDKPVAVIAFMCCLGAATGFVAVLHRQRAKRKQFRKQHRTTRVAGRKLLGYHSPSVISVTALNQRTWRAALAVLVLMAVTSAGVIRWRALRALRGAAETVASEQSFRFTVHTLGPAVENGFQWISAPAVFSDATVFRGRLYLCGPTGLFEFGSHGTLLKHYRAGLELPAAPVIHMAQGVLADSSEPELLMATAGEGVIAFNGRSFRQIRPDDPTAAFVTDLLPLSSGQLLLGTQKKGVLRYDGRRISVFHPTLANIYVTRLAGTEGDLWVGTLDRGVLHWHAGQTDQFSEPEGLPDPQVHSIQVAAERVFVGTSLGVAEFDSGKLVRTLANGTLARSLLAGDRTLLVGSMDEGVMEVPLQARRAQFAHAAFRSEVGTRPGMGAIQTFFVAEGFTYALAQDSLYARDPKSVGWHQVLHRDATLLTDRNISSLAVDSSGRLWVGYFDRGLDIVDNVADPSRQRATHVEDENVYCINRIIPDPARGVVVTATANGLVLFDGSGNKQQVLRRADGLIADHVTDVALYSGGMVLATPAGLTFLDRSGARSLYAFHGLVNNHVYALGISPTAVSGAKGQRVLAGTLGGISVLDNDSVVANYTTANSGLKHNWITAIVPVGSEWFIGTYGAGVLRVDNTGHVQEMENATTNVSVNPTAMLATDQHVLAGTLGRGLLVYNRDSGRWHTIIAGLPSANVTAIAASAGYVYVGTDNGLVRIREESLDR